MPLASAMTAAHDAGAAGGVYYDRDGITLYCGDAHDLLPQLEGPFATITDPPYNAGKNYGVATNDRMPWPEWCAWWDGVLALLLPISPVILATLSQTAWREYTRLGKYPPNWTLVWSKPLSLAVCALPFMPHWEPIAYWGNKRRRNGDGEGWGSDVITANVEFGKTRWDHPTPKPLNAMLSLVAKVEGPILDPFAGSGTTLAAAKQLGKRAIGIEIEERHCETIASRLQQTPESLFADPHP